MNEQIKHLSPFTKRYLLTFKEIREGFYEVQAVDDHGSILTPEELLTILFFRYELNMYGLQAHTTETSVELAAMELLDILNKLYRHPLIEWEASTDIFSEQLLANAHSLQQWWMNSQLWEYVRIEEANISFDLPHITAEVKSLLTTAVMQKLTTAELTIHDINILIPFFAQGGWPLQQHRRAGDVYVSLRLNEPADQQEVWLLETVLSSHSANYWTPPIRKRGLYVHEALPDKWLSSAEAIVEQQAQLLELLSIDTSHLTANVFLRTELEDKAVRTFLREDLARLQALGFDVVLPAWLRDLKQSRLKVRVSASNQSTKSVAGLDDLLTFKWKFSMNGEDISAEDFKKLVDEKREFIRIGTEWFRVDVAWMQEIRELMQQAEEQQFTVRELLFRELPDELSIPLEDSEDATRDDPMLTFELQQSLRAALEQLQEKKGLPSIPVPQYLETTLRPYQQQGFEWLIFMREQHFGACLADDMGLGKTVQFIAYLLYIKEHSFVDAPTIIICPTSVLGNWQKELARFAPSLKVHMHYSSGRFKESAFIDFLRTEQPDVVLSTYGTVSQDAEFLQHISWATVALDEAQNIKNMQTLQSRAIRKLQGAHHIALTGTPVENRLAELWAIFDFIHKGYLGSFGRFSEQFILPIERDTSEKHKAKLRAKIQPFLLRRTKRDPQLQLNLPEKQEQLEFCALTAEQAALYEGYIQETLVQLEQATGFEKKGKVLKMLSKLKQLCNHPALYLKEPFVDASDMMKRSVKLERIVQMAANIAERGEQCLIFTQYIGMGHLLQHCLSELHDIDVPFLTGSMAKQQRDRLVEAFQAGEFPIFLLSLKAGGTGLNLTAASHVLHADRWWNPAVENQATDRAYRIGQTRFVQVHKFVTIGTVEEKIDKILASKSALSEELITSGQWLTELNDIELRELMMLDV